MISGLRRLISVGALVCALAASITTTGDKTAGNGLQLQPGKAAANGQVATGIIEVRIRRLHLVRPDLIPYPIAYEIVC